MVPKCKIEGERQTGSRQKRRVCEGRVKESMKGRMRETERDNRCLYMGQNGRGTDNGKVTEEVVWWWGMKTGVGVWSHIQMLKYGISVSIMNLR